MPPAPPGFEPGPSTGISFPETLLASVLDRLEKLELAMTRIDDAQTTCVATQVHNEHQLGELREQVANLSEEVRSWGTIGEGAYGAEWGE